MPAPEGHRDVHDKLYAEKTTFATMPFFHAIGVVSVLRSIYCKSPLVLLPTGRPVNADLIIEAVEQTKPRLGFFAPSMMEEISGTPKGPDALGKMEYVFYGGAPLARVAGKKINTVTNV
ncbi:hypothetical protein LTR39_003420 [Cryomyces antarcticus]|nr:hypothetical protein LTR39_003420 [Cryomyces antarcticus]